MNGADGSQEGKQRDSTDAQGGAMAGESGGRLRPERVCQSWLALLRHFPSLDLQKGVIIPRSQG